MTEKLNAIPVSVAGRSYKMATCKRCRGKGSYMVANGPDDIDHEFCDDCEGTGLIKEET